MIAYQKSNIINELPLSDIAFEASIASQAECFFTERHRSDFAKKVIYAETEEAFRLREDDSLGPGFWRGEFWGKWVISSCRIARYKNDGELKNFLHQAALNLIATAEKLAAKQAEEETTSVDPEIDALVAARTEAKKAKNWAEADRIRDELKARGIEIIDTPQGAKWRKV